MREMRGRTNRRHDAAARDTMGLTEGNERCERGKTSLIRDTPDSGRRFEDAKKRCKRGAIRKKKKNKNEGRKC